MAQCDEHKFLLEKIDNIMVQSNLKDEESEREIHTIAMRMDKFDERLIEVEKKIDDLPEEVSGRISEYMDKQLLSIVKNFGKWFFRVLISGVIVFLAIEAVKLLLL